MLKSLSQSDIRPVKVWAKRFAAELLAMGLNRDMTGRQLKAFREGLGLSQQELADILKVQRVTVARAETGKYHKKQEANPDKEISRLLQMLLKEALGEALGSGIAVVREPGAQYGKKPTKKPSKKRS